MSMHIYAKWFAVIILVLNCTTLKAELFYPELGPVYFQFTNLEQIDVGITSGGTLSNNTSTCSDCSGDPEGNWGIAQLSVFRAGDPNPMTAQAGDIDNDIDNAGTVPQFVDQVVPTVGNQLTAMWYKVVNNQITVDDTVVSLASSGGYIDLYYDEHDLPGGGTIVTIGDPEVTPDDRTSDTAFPGFTDGVFLARLAFASGIDPADATTTVQGTLDTALANNSGSADSYGNVVDVNDDGFIDDLDGAWAVTLNSDWFGTVFGTRDVRFSNKLDLNINWDGEADVLGVTSNDPGRAYAIEEQPEIACRFTGGGVDTDLNWDHELEDGAMIRNGAGKLPEGIDRAQFGGQAGASTALPPQPSGEWTHHQQKGPSGNFTFHGGTKSAPIGSEVIVIRCSDPGGCRPSSNPPSPAKQLDFDGIGTFKSIGNGRNAPEFEIANPTVTDEGKGNKAFDGTYHFFQVNVDDLGERGGLNTGVPGTINCPDIGFGEKGAQPLANCECPDFYRITIHDGVSSADVTFDDEGNINELALLKGKPVIYEFYGYVDGGNLQLHQLTGGDRK